MIVFDTPRPAGFRRFRSTAHCTSDQLGEAGTAELLEFARRIGLKPEWLQNPGTETEHFDLFDGAIARARAAGAVEVEPRELIERCVRPKRAALRWPAWLQGDPPEGVSAAWWDATRAVYHDERQRLRREPTRDEVMEAHEHRSVSLVGCRA